MDYTRFSKGPHQKSIWNRLPGVPACQQLQCTEVGWGSCFGTVYNEQTSKFKNYKWSFQLHWQNVIPLHNLAIHTNLVSFLISFLPRCMECRRGLAMRFMSVCQTRALWQNGRKICPDFYTMRKIIQSSFMSRRMVGGGRPLLSEILGQPGRIGAKSPILNQ